MNKSPVKALAAIVAAATLVTPVHVNGGWTWECEDKDDIPVYVESGNTYSLNCGKLTSDRISSKSTSTFAIESGVSTATVKAGETYLKVLPDAGIPAGTTGGGCLATLTLPIEVSSLKPEKISKFCFEFDYAPSKGDFDGPRGNFGLSLHDRDGIPFLVFYGVKYTSFYIKSGSISNDSTVDSDAIATVSPISSYSDASTNAQWYHVVVSGANPGGVTLAVTNMNTSSEVALSSSILKSEFVLPSRIVVRTANHSGHNQWALLDNFSFSYKSSTSGTIIIVR